MTHSASTTQTVPMAGKTCMVTGASGGLGLATALALARMAATVLIVARDGARGQTALAQLRREAPAATIELYLADLSSQRQVRQLAAEVSGRHERLDVLVNNAGAVNRDRNLTEDNLEATLAVNHLAPFLLTHLLEEKLKTAAPSRVVNVSSYLHKMIKEIPWDDIQAERDYSSHTVYNLTKLMNVLFTYDLAQRWAAGGVTVNCLHPGWPLRTNLGREESGTGRLFDRATKVFAKSATDGARTSVYLASSPAVAKVTGVFYTSCKKAESSQLSHDERAATRLRRVSAELCGLAAQAVA